MMSQQTLGMNLYTCAAVTQAVGHLERCKPAGPQSFQLLNEIERLVTFIYEQSRAKTVYIKRLGVAQRINGKYLLVLHKS